MAPQKQKNKTHRRGTAEAPQKHRRGNRRGRRNNRRNESTVNFTNKYSNSKNKQSPKICCSTFWRLTPHPGRSATALGRDIDRIERNIEWIESKVAKIFKRPKNCWDTSDFDDFWTESIVSTQSIFSQILERTKNYQMAERK